MDRAACCRAGLANALCKCVPKIRQDSFAVTVEMDCFASTDNLNAETYSDFETRSLHELFG